MLVLAIVFIVIVAALIILLAGRAMGPITVERKFDEIPADVIAMDTSDGTPVGHIEIWSTPAEQQVSGADIAIMEKFSNIIRGGRRP